MDSQVKPSKSDLRSPISTNPAITNRRLIKESLHQSVITSSILIGCGIYNCTITSSTLVNCHLWGVSTINKCLISVLAFHSPKSTLNKLPVEIRDLIFEEYLHDTFT